MFCCLLFCLWRGLCKKYSINFHKALYDYGLMLEEEAVRFGGRFIPEWRNGNHFGFLLSIHQKRIDYSGAKQKTVSGTVYTVNSQQLEMNERTMLISIHHSQLDTNRTCTVFADRALCSAAPSVWNSLPLYITDNLDSPAGFKSAAVSYTHLTLPTNREV